MNHADLLIIDHMQKGLKRYAIDIAKEIKAIAPGITIGAVYTMPEEPGHIDNMDFVCCAREFGDSPERIYDFYRPKAILLFDHRIFDYAFTLAAHRRNMRVYNFQHALYTAGGNNTGYSVSLVLKGMQGKLKNLFANRNYILQLADARRLKAGALLCKLLKPGNLNAIINAQFGSLCNADVSFIYGKYWIKYYKEKYRDTTSEFDIIGYPELEGKCQVISATGFNRHELKTICYLTDTSVESMSVKKAEFQLFLKKLSQVTAAYNLVVKYHPRSNRKLYDPLFSSCDDGNIAVWEEPEFPIADAYIVHKSTIIARALHVTDKVMIYHFEKEEANPFEHFAKYIAGVQDDFTHMIHSMLEEENEHAIRGRLEEYAAMNKGAGAIKETARKIVDDLSCRAES